METTQLSEILFLVLKSLLLLSPIKYFFYLSYDIRINLHIIVIFFQLSIIWEPLKYCKNTIDPYDDKVWIPLIHPIVFVPNEQSLYT